MRLVVGRLREQREIKGEGPVDEATLKSLIEVVADNASNTLIVTAPETIQPIAEELIKSLDAEGSASGRNVVRVVPLAFAEAQGVAQTLNQTLATMDLPSGGKVSVVASPASGAVLLSGLKADLDKVEELIKPLDVRRRTRKRPA